MRAEVFGGDAGAEVLHAEFDLGIHAAARQPERRLPALPYLQGVFHKVAEDLVHGVGIGQNKRVRRAGRFEYDPGIDHHAAQRIDGVGHQRAGGRGLQRELVVGAFDAGQRQQVSGDAVHARRVLVNDGEELARGFRRWGGSSIRVST